MEAVQTMFKDFNARIDNDLAKWNDRKTLQLKTLNDYEATLDMVLNQSQTTKLQVDLGAGFFMQARRTTPNPKLRLRVKDDLILQVTFPQAAKILPELITLWKQKVETSEKQIAKIVASREQLFATLQKYSTMN